MRSFILVSGLAWLHQAAAACCRGNPCLKAIVSASAQGLDDCSRNAAVYTTPDTITITETRTVPTDILDTIVTQTSTVSTETDVIIVSETVTASTETDVLFATETVLATVTATDTDVLTATPTLHIKKRRPTISSSTGVTTSAAPSSPRLPLYASQCPAWANYISACSCAGVAPITVTAAAPSTTITVDAVATSTVVSTSTVLAAVTATTAVTQTTVDSVTVTTLITETTILAETATATIKQTQTTTPLITKNVSAFRATATADAATEYLFADWNDSGGGALSWGPPPNSPDISVLYSYLWLIDGVGIITMADLRPGGYMHTWAPCVTTGSGAQSIQATLNDMVLIETNIQEGQNLDWVYASVNATTNELFLSAEGRTNILYCDGDLYFSHGLGEDVDEDCVLVHLSLSSPAEQH